jgi:hypothetical protein
MRRWGLVAALMFLVLTNVVLWARLAYNRSGEPEATVALTGREVRFEAGWRGLERKPGRPVSVSLIWNQDFTPWLTQDKLESLGFDLRLPPYAKEEAYSYYWSLLPRQAYVVLEYDGQGYEAWRRDITGKLAALEEKEKQEKLDKGEKNQMEKYKLSLSPASSQSRLFAVDAGAHAEALRRQYADRQRFIIAPCQVRVKYVSTWDKKTQKSGPPTIKGGISELLVSTIHISAHQRDRLEEIIPRLEKAADHQPRLPTETGVAEKEIDPEKRRLVNFTICYGQSYEPWVADIRAGEEAK